MTIQFRGGLKLDKALREMDRNRDATNAAYSALSAGATQVKKGVKSVTPVMKDRQETEVKRKGQKGIKIVKGQLKKSVTSGLRKKAAKSRNVFMASVWFKNAKGGGKEGVDDGFHVVWNKPDQIVKKGVKKSENAFKNKVGGTLAKKIALIHQRKIDAIKG